VWPARRRFYVKIPGFKLRIEALQELYPQLSFLWPDSKLKFRICQPVEIISVGARGEFEGIVNVKPVFLANVTKTGDYNGLFKGGD